MAPPQSFRDGLDEHRRGNLGAAASIYESVLAENPDDVDALYLLGVVAIQRGNAADGVAFIGRAAELRPDDATIHANLAEAYRALGYGRRVVECCHKSLELEPTSADVHCNLALALEGLNDLAAAAEHYRRAIELEPRMARAHHGLGKVCQLLGQLDEARGSFAAVLQIEPRHADSHAAFAHIHEQLGDFETANRALRLALNIEPRHAGALARLATRQRGELAPCNERAIEEILADPGTPVEARIQLRFGLAQVYDDREEFARAAEMATEANRLRHAQLVKNGIQYHAASHLRTIERLMDSFTHEFFERVRGFGSSSQRPVFIVGLPRSGTSLAEQILASHPRVFGAGELKLVRQVFEMIPGAIEQGGLPFDALKSLTAPVIGQLADRYLAELAAIDDSADRIVDKMLDNTIYLGLIATLFPHAKLIHCTRNARDVAVSCWMTDFMHVAWACEPNHIALRVQIDTILMQHWRKVLPCRMLEVRYEDVVADLEASARAMVAWCGLEWDSRCLDFHTNGRAVRTASVDQVRRPLHGRSVGRWKNYEHTLMPLFRWPRR